MYGGIKENLVEEVIQRGRLHKDSTFVDVGSGIGQVSTSILFLVLCCVGIILNA